MVIHVMKLYFLILIWMLEDYDCIGEDYFIFKENPQTESDIFSVSTKNETVVEKNDMTDNSIVVDGESNKSFTVFMPKRKMAKEKETPYPSTDHFNSSNLAKTLRATTSNVTKKKLHMHNVLQTHFDSYKYDYESEETTLSYAEVNVTTSHFKEKLRDNISQVNHETIEIKHKLPYIDFFNLKPVVSEIENITNIYSHIEETWYVPEKYPCWELPLLYGELGMKMKSKVFRLFTGHLKNVIIKKGDPGTHNSHNKVPSVNIRRTYNKWCGVKPCYGDHTLCLYSDNVLSKMCYKDYNVRLPSNMEQIALVNTINSMRNRVATGQSQLYAHLPSAANMNQIIYDFDLEKMSEMWLRQCLPGPAPCSALEENLVTQLECTKNADECCKNAFKINPASKCKPRHECFIQSIIGCIYTWFSSAGQNLKEIDVACGHTDRNTYNTAQLLWAKTNKIGCAYGVQTDGDVRVVCNFAPGTPFLIETKFYCGIIHHKDITDNFLIPPDITDLKFLASQGIDLHPVVREPIRNITLPEYFNPKLLYLKNLPSVFNEGAWGVESLSEIYKERWVRDNLKDYSNGTRGLIARLVTQYVFHDRSEAKCDSKQPIYETGEPGSNCVELGRRFNALCYFFRDPTPGYRLVAVLAPVALFTLILYDLFGGVLRQTNK